VIERCSGLAFAALCEFDSKEALLKQFWNDSIDDNTKTEHAAAHQAKTLDVWKQVQDFDWIKATQSPNWRLLEQHELMKEFRLTEEKEEEEQQ